MRKAAWVVFGVSCCYAAESNPDELLRWMDGTAQQQLDRREAGIRAIQTVEQGSRLDSLDPEHFQYELTSREISSSRP